MIFQIVDEKMADYKKNYQFRSVDLSTQVVRFKGLITCSVFGAFAYKYKVIKDEITSN